MRLQWHRMKYFQLTDKEGLSLPRNTMLSTQEQTLAWSTAVTEALMQAQFTCEGIHTGSEDKTAKI